jgi:hypothetical protein
MSRKCLYWLDYEGACNEIKRWRIWKKRGFWFLWTGNHCLVKLKRRPESKFRLLQRLSTSSLCAGIARETSEEHTHHTVNQWTPLNSHVSTTISTKYHRLTEHLFFLNTHLLPILEVWQNRKWQTKSKEIIKGNYTFIKKRASYKWGAYHYPI